MKDNKDLKDYILETFSKLKNIRAKTEAERGKAISLVYPQRNVFNSSDRALYDGSGRDAHNTLVNGILGHLLSPSIEWFKLYLQEGHYDMDKIHGAADWLEECEAIMYAELQRSNFYQQAAEFIADSSAQGTAAMWMRESVNDEGVVTFQTISPDKYYIDENHDRWVDTFCYKYKLTAKQAIDYFDDDATEKLQKSYEDDPYEEHEFIHMVMRRRDRDTFKNDIENMPWASVHYSYTDDEVIKISGFDEFPILVHRWSRGSADSPYGNGPGNDSIVDMTRLNRVTKSQLLGADLATNPPLMVPEELRGKLRMMPGAYNYYQNPNNQVRPIQQQIDFSVSLKIQEDIRKILDRNFYVEYFMMLARSERQMTAREVIERMGEKAAIIGPVVGRLQVEFLAPLIKRLFTLLGNERKLPPPPYALISRNRSGQRSQLKIELMGPLAQAMKQYHHSQGIARGLETLMPFMQIDPHVADNIDMDEAVRIALIAEGWPQKALREIRDRDEIRRQKQEAMQQQQELEQEMQAAEIMQKGGQRPEPGSPAAQMLQQGQGAIQRGLRGDQS